MTAPDWCHVAVRVERTRRMRQIKHAELGYEDEAMSYLIATLTRRRTARRRASSRART